MRKIGTENKMFFVLFIQFFQIIPDIIETQLGSFHFRFRLKRIENEVVTVTDIVNWTLVFSVTW